MFNMKKILFLTLISVLISVACTNDKAPELLAENDVLSVVTVATNSSEESKEELEKIGSEGFRLIEFADESTLLQQSVWKFDDDKWSPQTEIKAVEGGLIVSVYPAGEVQKGTDRTLMAGVNNMLSVQRIDRSTENAASVVFSHEMCQVVYRLFDSNGKELHIGNNPGEVKSVCMTQPVDVVCNILDGTQKDIGRMESLPLVEAENNYVIPGGDNYEVTAVYLNSDGGEEVFKHKISNAMVKNKKYVVNFKLDTSTLRMLEVSVSVEKWDFEEVDCELEKENDTDVYKAGDDVPDGFYAAYIVGGEKCAVAPDQYDVSNQALGVLVVKDGHRFVLAPKLPYDGPVNWADPSVQIDGVTVTTDVDEACQDMNGRANTDAIIAWTRLDKFNDATAAEKCAEFKFAGVENWYLPAAGELNYIMDSIDKIKDVMDKIGGSEVDWTRKPFWSSTQENDKNAYQWSETMMIMMVSDKTWSYAGVCAVTDF